MKALLLMSLNYGKELYSMKCNYYTRAKLTAIILDLIYLYQEMDFDGHTDKLSLKELASTINNLKYYLQFLEKSH